MSDIDRRWRYDSGPERPERRPDELQAFETMLDTAWRELLLEHMPFGVVSNDERERLLRGFREVERTFFVAKEDTLRDYYRESYLRAPPSYASYDGENRDALLRHVVLLQAQLMEQAFFALTLSRAANAPTNRGWMNLFRRWAASQTFNFWFDEYRELFSRQFVAFYDNYLRFYGTTIDVVPVRHPWDPPLTLWREPPPRDEEQVRREMLWQWSAMPTPVRAWNIPGVYLDSGIVEMPVDSLTGESSDASGGTPDAVAAPSPGATESGTDATGGAEQATNE